MWRGVVTSYCGEYSLKWGFSSPELLVIGAGYFFIMGGCPMHCRIFNNTPVSSLHASKIYIHPSPDNQKCLQKLA